MSAFRHFIRNAVGLGSPAEETLKRVVIKSPINRADELRVTGAVLLLCRYSRLHSSYPVEMLNGRIGPSLLLRQFHYYTDRHGAPVAFCNWAWLNASVLDDVLATGRDLWANEFRCGDLPFFYEFLAPFGHCRAVVRDLRGLSFFKGCHIPSIRGETCDGTPRVPRVQYFQF